MGPTQCRQCRNAECRNAECRIRTVLVVPLSSSVSPPHPPITVKVSCMGKNALAVCDQLRAVDKTRLTDWIEAMDERSLDSIGKALQQVLSL
ncbi:MAG TPA: type II toxin-antitoxin system PemK/MazF family toxin [Syntrophobacteraceae bacterium]|nr:type II toxin-antitoxin system PemK/MazF family toxin [Syntrophobacteraceae bacterium]